MSEVQDTYIGGLYYLLVSVCRRFIAGMWIFFKTIAIDIAQCHTNAALVLLTNTCINQISAGIGFFCQHTAIV